MGAFCLLGIATEAQRHLKAMDAGFADASRLERITAGFSSNRTPKEGVAQLQRVFCFYFHVCSGWICVHLRNLRPTSSSVSLYLRGLRPACSKSAFGDGLEPNPHLLMLAILIAFNLGAQ